jgi:hypothetical protein
MVPKEWSFLQHALTAEITASLNTNTRRPLRLLVGTTSRPEVWRWMTEWEDIWPSHIWRYHPTTCVSEKRICRIHVLNMGPPEQESGVISRIDSIDIRYAVPKAKHAETNSLQTNAFSHYRYHPQDFSYHVHDNVFSITSMPTRTSSCNRPQVQCGGTFSRPMAQ